MNTTCIISKLEQLLREISFKILIEELSEDIYI